MNKCRMITDIYKLTKYKCAISNLAILNLQITKIHITNVAPNNQYSKTIVKLINPEFTNYKYTIKKCKNH